MDFEADQAFKNYQQEKKAKQNYLRDYITNQGYDSADFAHFLSWQRGKSFDLTSDDGTNIDNWTFEDLKQCV